MYLVDTDVISQGAPSKGTTLAALVTWMDEHSDSLFLSAITIAEIEDGIAKVRREGASRKAGALASWLETLLHLYQNRVVPFDISIARVAGKLSDLARSKGQKPGFADVAIAATATALRLTVLTRNIRHFVFLDVPVHNPFESLP